MSQEGPLAESVAGASVLLLSPNTSAARFDTSEALTCALSLLSGSAFRALSVRWPVSACCVATVASCWWFAAGGVLAGAGPMLGAGAWAHAASIAAVDMSRALFTNLLQRGL